MTNDAVPASIAGCASTRIVTDLSLADLVNLFEKNDVDPYRDLITRDVDSCR